MTDAAAGGETELLVTDIDNTLFDWVSYYVHAFSALLQRVETTIGVSYATLAAEARDVFTTQGSIEYPFLVQELPSVMRFYGDDIEKMLKGAVSAGRDAFLAAAEPHLKPYAGVVEALDEIRRRKPALPLVALTDAPRYVAMWKLNKLGLLPRFTAVYGLGDPRLPLTTNHARVKVDPEILQKHLSRNDFGFKGRIRILPDDYEKPGTRGLKTVLMDFEKDDDPAHRKSVLWIGDNERKDVALGKKLGVRTAWAKYGLPTAEHLRRLAEFSPALNIHKNARIAPDESAPAPDYVFETFTDVLKAL